MTKRASGVVLQARGEASAAYLFLESGTYELQLVPPARKQTEEAPPHAWQTRPRDGWQCLFCVWTPEFSAHQVFGTRVRADSQAGAVAAFNKLSLKRRSFVVRASRGRPVMFFINDLQDGDNEGGLTIALKRTALPPRRR